MAGDPRDRPVTARDLSAAVIVILSGLFLTSFTILGALFLTWTPVGEFTFFLVVSVAFLGVFAGWSVYLDAGDRRWSTARGRASLPPGGSARPGSTLPDGPPREAVWPHSVPNTEPGTTVPSPSGSKEDRAEPP